MGDSVQDPRWKIKEKFVGKCFPIFSRAAVPRRQPDASEEAKNRLTVFTFASDPRFQESTKIARERRPCDRRRSTAIVRGLANFKLIVYFENPAISISLLKMRWECLLSSRSKADSSHLIFADQKFIPSEIRSQKWTLEKFFRYLSFSGSYRKDHRRRRTRDISKQRNNEKFDMSSSWNSRRRNLSHRSIYYNFLTSRKMPIFRDSGFWKQTT